MNLDRRHIQVIANALLHGASRSSTCMTEVGRISHSFEGGKMACEPGR
jgi:hypothetical protein